VVFGGPRLGFGDLSVPMSAWDPKADGEEGTPELKCKRVGYSNGVLKKYLVGPGL
jgi:hypothetical protein